MTKIDFVPNDYIQQRESSRANLISLILLGIVMVGIGLTFSILKVRQKNVQSDLTVINARMTKANEQILQLEQLTDKKNVMMKTALLTAELLEPVPRSLILASLTNSLPAGASLLEVKIVTKETKIPPKTTTQYEDASKKTDTKTEQKITNTNIDITGIAFSDIDVANYIAALTDSVLLDKVGLVESKERKIDNTILREFKLKAAIKKNLKLTKQDIESLKANHNKTI